MTKPLYGICDKGCGKILTIDFQEQKHPNNIQETYFECEHCYYHYTSYVTDIKVRKWQHKVQTIRKAGTSSDKILTIQKDINSRMAMLKDNLIKYGRADLL